MSNKVPLHLQLVASDLVFLADLALSVVGVPGMSKGVKV